MNREARRKNHKNFKSNLKHMPVRELRTLVFNINEQGNLELPDSWIMTMNKVGLIAFITKFHQMVKLKAN